jgi:hypothetical protein
MVDLNTGLLVLVFGYLVRIEHRITKVEEKVKEICDEHFRDNEDCGGGGSGTVRREGNKG